MLEFNPNQNININISYNLLADKPRELPAKQTTKSVQKCVFKSTPDHPKRFTATTAKKPHELKKDSKKPKKRIFHKLETSPERPYYERKIKTEASQIFTSKDARDSKSGQKHHRSVLPQDSKINFSVQRKSPKALVPHKKSQHLKSFAHQELKRQIVELNVPGSKVMVNVPARRRCHSASGMVKEDKLVSRILNLSLLGSDLGGSQIMSSERASGRSASSKGFKDFMGSMEMRLISSMKDDATLAAAFPHSHSLSAYLLYDRRIPIEVLNRSAKVIQSYWRKKRLKQVIGFYKELFQKATLHTQGSFSSIHIDEIILSDDDSHLFGNENATKTTKINFDKYKEIVNDHLKKEDEKIKRTKEQQNQHWNNINRLISSSLNSNSTDNNSLLKELIKQSALNKEWVEAEDDSAVKCQLEEEIDSTPQNQQTATKSEQPSESNYDYQKYLQNSQSPQEPSQSEPKPKDEPDCVKNYLECGLVEFGIQPKPLVQEKQQEQGVEDDDLDSSYDLGCAVRFNKPTAFDPSNLHSDPLNHGDVQEDIQQAFETIYFGLLTQFSYEIASILRKPPIKKAKEQPIKKHSISAKGNSINVYLNSLIDWIINAPERKQTVTENINVDTGPTAMQMLFYEREQPPQEEDDGGLMGIDGSPEPNDELDGIASNHRYVIPHSMFFEFQDYLVQERQRNEAVQMTNRAQELLYYWHQCIFDSFNELLEEQRPFGLIGRPYPWQISAKTQHLITLSQIQTKLRKACQRATETSQYRVGMLFEDEQLRVAGMDGLDKHQLNEQRLMWMLAHELYDQEELWNTFSDFTIGVLIELSEFVQNRLITELKTDLVRIQRKRLSMIRDEPVSVYLAQL